MGCSGASWGQGFKGFGRLHSLGVSQILSSTFIFHLLENNCFPLLVLKGVFTTGKNISPRGPNQMEVSCFTLSFRVASEAIDSAQNDHATVVQSILANKEAHVRKIHNLFTQLPAESQDSNAALNHPVSKPHRATTGFEGETGVPLISWLFSS